VSEPANTLRIRSAAELLSALAHPDSAVRTAVITHIGQQPDQALAFGEDQGKSVIDALIDAANASSDNGETMGILWAMQSFPDERLARYCAECLLRCMDDRQSMLLYHYLTTHEVPWQRDVLLPLLWQTERLTNAELAAQLLAFADCEDADRIRISAILGRKGAALWAFDSNKLPHWLDELRSSWADNAREYLTAWGHEAYASLVTHWEELDHRSQQWLIRWGAGQNFPERVALIDLALQSHCNKVIEEALRDTEAVGAMRNTLTTPLETLLSHQSAAIRAGAVRAGAQPEDWQDILQTESDPSVLGACMAALAHDLGSRAVPLLLGALEHEEWAVVAAATEALAGLGEDAVAAVAPMVEHQALQVRVAADRIRSANQ
jgi:hypothetical protein